MYLKSLEIQGFKSFADKTVLTFDDDITAIVGPNGSGKSNISDAIRWVMGEQSTKSLRGAKMEDVIFGGTLKRPPLGFAEVSLILDNTSSAFRTEGTEVMVTRRYYRSGESEYYINRRAARLRDINELFMDTGLGNEGYSNIGQGRIDEILAARSVDRREVFEEAAGISKYRHHKEETERRLASTEENLTRIGDKISELELQLEPLRAQAEKAKKYLALREELRGLEVTVWLSQLQGLTQAAEKAEADHLQAAAQLENAHRELDALYQENERLSAELHAHDSKLDTLREAIAAAEAEEQRALGEKRILENNLQNCKQNAERIREELNERSSGTGGLAAQIQQKQARIQELLKEIGAMQAKLEQALGKERAVSASAQQLTDNLLQKRAEQAKLLMDTTQSRAAFASEAAHLHEWNARLEELQNSEQDAQFALLKHNAEDCHKKLAAAREKVTGVQNRISGYELRYASRAEKKEKLEQQYGSLSVEADTVRARIKMYQEMERDYEGFSKAVREVMRQAERGTLQNIHGPISRLMHVDSAYTTAIETAMGSSMQSIVVDTEEDGRNAIQFLKHSDAGRATFLPLRAIRGRRLQENGLSACSGFVGLASDLVETEARYRAVVEDLLGRTVITETIDNAIAVARKYANRFRIVTLDGQVMNVGGSMTGGSVAKNSGILARENALQELQQKRDALALQLQELDTQLQSSVRLAAESEYELQTEKEQLRLAEDAVLRLEGDCKQCDAVLLAAQEAQESARAEQKSVQERIADGNRRMEALKAALAEREAEMAALEETSAGLTAQQEKLTAEEEAAQQEINDLKLQAASLDAERAACETSLAQLRLLQREMEQENVQRETLIQQYEKEAERLRGELANNETEIVQANADAQARRAELVESSAARRETEADRTAAEKKVQDQNKELLLLERETARLEQQKTTAELEQNQIIDRLWDTYGLTNSTALPLRVEIESVTAANRKIATLKQRLNALGTPNLGAIDEFERVGERYDYLTGQRSDVLESRKELEGIITTITEEMTSIFLTEFQKINAYFSTTFVEMFGGGKASLELENSACPLECGIEIRVQPPGKQLKTISLLSGGEKAFVAIALYFAILRVRPTPFCLLDEIDAALDERNVARFAEYLRNLCQKTQFLVITHRRGTMEACDVLYGVTMQEQGVSRVLGIHLNELQTELGIEA